MAWLGVRGVIENSEAWRRGGNVGSIKRNSGSMAARHQKRVAENGMA